MRASEAVRQVEDTAITVYKRVEVAMDQAEAKIRELFAENKVRKVLIKREGQVVKEVDMTNAAVVATAGALLLSRLHPAIGVLSTLGVALSGYTVDIETTDVEPPAGEQPPAAGDGESNPS